MTTELYSQSIQWPLESEALPNAAVTIKFNYDAGVHNDSGFSWQVFGKVYNKDTGELLASGVDNWAKASWTTEDRHTGQIIVNFNMPNYSQRCNLETKLLINSDVVATQSAGFYSWDVTNPHVAVNNSPVAQGAAVNFSISGFLPNSQVVIKVSGNTVKTVTTDGLGTYGGTFTTSLPGGNYTITASDSNGNSASASFIITGVTPGEPSVELISKIINLFIKGVKVTIGKAGDPASMEMDYTAAVHNDSGFSWQVFLKVFKGTTLLNSGVDNWTKLPTTTEDERTGHMQVDFALPNIGTASSVVLTAQVLINSKVVATQTFTVTYSTGQDPDPGTGEGTLICNSTPTGAQVSINNTVVGFTPLTKVLGIGNWLVKFVKDGYDSYQEVAVISEGQTSTINATLNETVVPVTGGKINVESTPTEAGVFKGTTMVGVTPCVLTVDAGTLTLTIKRDGYNNVSKTFTIVDGDVKSWNAILTATGGGGDGGTTSNRDLYVAIGAAVVALIAIVIAFRK